MREISDTGQLDQLFPQSDITFSLVRWHNFLDFFPVKPQYEIQNMFLTSPKANAIKQKLR